VQLTVGELAHGGAAVARIDGRVVFVEGAIPGETVEADTDLRELVEARALALKARKVKIVVDGDHEPLDRLEAVPVVPDELEFSRGLARKVDRVEVLGLAEAVDQVVAFGGCGAEQAPD